MSNPPGLSEAIKAGDLARVKALLDEDPSRVNARGAILNIFEAAAVGDTLRMRDLWSEDPSRLNAYAPDGFTLLGLAAFFGHTDTAAFLLEQGAEVNRPSQNPMRVMPLHSAVAGRRLAIAEMLLARGADANARPELGFTPLYTVAHNGQAEMVRLLLDHGADPRLAKDDGKAPWTRRWPRGITTWPHYCGRLNRNYRRRRWTRTPCPRRRSSTNLWATRTATSLA